MVNTTMRARRPGLAVSEFVHYSAPLRSERYTRTARRKGFQAAHECARQLEKVLAIGNYLFSAVQRIERNWRNEVLAGQVEFELSDENSVDELFSLWLEPCQECLREIKRIRSKRIEVPGAKQFERNYRDALKRQAAGSPFFDDVDSAGKWAALTSKHREPLRAVELEADGRIVELTGKRFVMRGLAPSDVQRGVADYEAGRTHTLREVIARREGHGI